MKKLSILTLICMSLSLSAFAQDNPGAEGTGAGATEAPPPPADTAPPPPPAEHKKGHKKHAKKKHHKKKHHNS